MAAGSVRDRKLLSLGLKGVVLLLKNLQIYPTKFHQETLTLKAIGQVIGTHLTHSQKLSSSAAASTQKSCFYNKYENFPNKLFREGNSRPTTLSPWDGERNGLSVGV